jgi:hypothetical protein
VAEFFQDTRAIDRRHREPWLVGFRLLRDLRLHSLRGKWPTRAGASTSINSGPRPRCRAWSRAIHGLYEGVEGILYCSSTNADREALALYERAEDALPAHPRLNVPLSHPAIRFELERMADDLGYDDLR